VRRRFTLRATGNRHSQHWRRDSVENRYVQLRNEPSVSNTPMPFRRHTTESVGKIIAVVLVILHI
jgi:hypothetical protein